uniref:Origin recognition complex subunit 1 n=1 Tax=Anopheles dirus TaxID=7168 RepID=A0A182N1Y5_9DIPT
MKNKSLNNNTITSPITWVGKQYSPDESALKVSALKHRVVAFYPKCIFGALTLEVGNFILVSNLDAAEPDSLDGCDVARIVHMYEVLHSECTNMDPCRAIVEWYSRPSGLPKAITGDENHAFDAREVIADSRFSPDISIETIFSICLVEQVSLQTNLQEVLHLKSSSRIPTFVTRYKLAKSSVKKWHLEPLVAAPSDTSSPRKRRSMYDSSNQQARATPRTPKLKLTRTKSMENLATLNVEQKSKLIEDRWAVKLIDVRHGIDHITDGLSEVDISEDERKMSPSKHAKLEKVRKSSIGLRSYVDVPTSGTDDECLNYSIVRDGAANERDMKIKLRISETQKQPTTPKSLRKRTPSTTSTVSNEHVSPPKCRKSLLPSDVESIVGTPTGRSHRRSILKTPSTKAQESAAGTPKRNIQLSNIVEECSNGRRVSRLLELSPKKADMPIVHEEPKTPKRSSRSSLAATNGSASKSTPKSASKMKLIRAGTIKPSIHSRDAPIEQGMSELAIARQRLHVSATPSGLPCREKEYEEIYSFLEGKIIDGCSGCMYVSGVPGTGKTATTTAVIRELKQLSEEEEIPKFDFVDINGMRLTEPRQAYVHIYRQLTGKTLAWEQAYNLLNKRFTTKAPRRITTVLLVDELDILCNKRQDVVYNILNWPTVPAAQLIVVTIANTMDLPERLLMGKISSRLGLTRLTFQPYNFRQLQEIVMARLTGTSAFNSDAVQLVARKVAAVSGDARRALDICRRATELADESTSTETATVVMSHVQEALEEMITSAKVKTIRSCSRMEQLFLQAVTAEVTRTGIEECNFLGVYAQFESLAAFAGISVPNPGRAMAICSRLGASRLLICETGRNDIYQKILLNISTDDVHFALQASKLL